jgi:hypothetical protein
VSADQSSDKFKKAGEEWAIVKAEPTVLQQYQQKADDKNAESANSEPTAAAKKAGLLAIKKSITDLVNVIGLHC